MGASSASRFGIGIHFFKLNFTFGTNKKGSARSLFFLTEASQGALVYSSFYKKLRVSLGSFIGAVESCLPLTALDHFVALIE